MVDEQGEALKVRYFWPNRLGRMFLVSLEDVMGRSGVNAVLSQAKLRHLINNYPGDNLNLGWSFEEMAALSQALDDMHGPEGGRALAIRAGRAAFYHSLDDLGAVLGLAEVTFRLLPPAMRVRLGLSAIADTFNKTSDQVVCLEQERDRWLFRVERCPICWGRASEVPICHALVGLLHESTYWLTRGKDLSVKEVECIARGDATCCYEIAKRLSPGDAARR